MMILQTSEIDSIYEAMQLLNTHNLAHFFVSHQALNRALAYFERYLQSNHPELTLLRRDIQYYYRQASFSVFRSRNTLAKYCLRYSLLASQSKLRLVACESRWAGDVNNATASGSQLLAT